VWEGDGKRKRKAGLYQRSEAKEQVQAFAIPLGKSCWEAILTCPGALLRVRLAERECSLGGAVDW